jgi:hypothetical protein
MPRSSKKASASNKAPGYWVTYDTDMGPVPRGTPCMCMKDCMKITGASGIDCVLFWANHHVHQGKKDGNVWMLGQWSKCTAARACFRVAGGRAGHEVDREALGRHLPEGRPRHDAHDAWRDDEAWQSVLRHH